MLVDYGCWMGGEMDRIGTAELRSALGWWLEAGVDVIAADEPRNWLKADRAPTEAAAAEAPAKPQAEPQSPAIVHDSLEGFTSWLRDAADLPFTERSARRVLPVGSEAAPLMLLGDMPALDSGGDEGPITGDAWTLLQRMLAAAGLDPAQAYRASLSCFHRISGLGRGPELQACADLARRHIALVKPRNLLLLGDSPCRALLGKSLAAARGHVQKIEGVRTIATFHPSFLIMHPLQKEAAWSDLLLLTEEQ
jgi:DNA polymerase